MSPKSKYRYLKVTFLILPLLLACEKKSDLRRLIPEETFVKLYIDLEFAKVDFLSKPDSLKDTIAFQDSLVYLFKAYQVSPKAYQEQLNAYAVHPLEWQAVQNIANTQIRKLREEQDSIKKSREMRYRIE
ncbi:MAG: hypothetical protein SFU91_07995 [Chloroherpetonaceae bacterium]|nr:hypothetical protein [Chloroherpetonaceae bacterium]